MSNQIEQLKSDLSTQSARLVDVREPFEWQQGHLRDAVLVPLSALNSGHHPEGLDKSQRIYLHCRSGRRVFAAKPLLERQGFVDVIALTAGYDQLVAAGLPVADEDAP